jgi:hypothetical protein
MPFAFRYLNPFLLYERRQLIPIYARNYWHDTSRFIRPRVNKVRAQLALWGLPLTVDDERLARLKDTHRGQRAFVIGTGRSLRVADLDRLGDELTFASNRIYVCFKDTSWRPTYYATTYRETNPGYYSEIAAIERSVKLLPLAARLRCAPVPGAIYFRHTHEEFYPNLPKFSVNALDTVYWGGTITYILIQFAVYMGIREIYLLGMDFDYGQPPAPAGTKPGEPFVVPQADPCHFHPAYMRAGEITYFPVLHLHEKAYEAAKMNVEALGGRIFNATRGGKLEIFPRVNFDDLF